MADDELSLCEQVERFLTVSEIAFDYRACPWLRDQIDQGHELIKMIEAHRQTDLREKVADMIDRLADLLTIETC